MNNQPQDKKLAKISFSDSSDERECSYNWDRNFSSDEDYFFNGKSEVLWSRSEDYFNYSISPQEFSDLTGRTLSSCSWHNDEFDMKSTSKVNASLEAIDDALYDKVKSSFMSDTLFQECCDWAERFPFFRITGEPIVSPFEDNLSLQPFSAIGCVEHDFKNSCTSLQLQGKKIPLHSVNKSKEIYFDCASRNKVPGSLKEEACCETDEYLALHRSDEAGSAIHSNLVDDSKSTANIKALQGKVLDELVAEVWPNVLALLQKLDDKNNMNGQLQLPPIIVASEQKRAFDLQRPRTEGSNCFSTEFPKLENSLTVSPKILQKRQFGNSFIARPSSEMSIKRVSAKSLKSVSYGTNSSSVQSKSDSLHIKGTRNIKMSENSCLVLPSLEEDFQDASSMLRGFHIEPTRKEMSNKAALSSRNEYEPISTTRENEYFLPPIKDKSYIPTNIKLTKNLFTFYGPPVTKTCGSAKYRKTNSRPSTSVSIKALNNNEFNPKFSMKNGLYITQKNMGKTPRHSHTERQPGENLTENETSIVTQQEKSVTLFPIVTPLTPHEEKDHTSRKGLLHSFLRVKKR